VITVPAYFDDAQRKATRNAGELAGLKVRRIINEPTAAALAYDHDLETDQIILVYDIGGGTFDASLVVVQNGVVEVKASHGNTHLGGDDFDRLLMDYADDLFFEQHGVRLKTDLKAANRLWAAVEKAKCELSDAPYARIREEFIVNDLHLDLEIARSDYEEMIRPLLDKTMDSVHRCFKDAAMLPGAVDKVILVGGASRTPLVSELVGNAIGTEPRHEVDPDLIVAMGAAIQAGVINGQKTHSILVDITPYTFGTSAIGMLNGKMREDLFVPLIQRGTALPAKKGDAFATMYDNQEAVDVRIYQGEAPLAEDNIFIGNFLVEGLSDSPAGNGLGS
jgi:molecular chaperone DnaK